MANFVLRCSGPRAFHGRTSSSAPLLIGSTSAHDRLPRETLTRLCTSPLIGVLELQWDFGSSAIWRFAFYGLYGGSAFWKPEVRRSRQPNWSDAACTGKRRSLIGFCNSTFRPRDQIFGIRGAASFPNDAGADNQCWAFDGRRTRLHRRQIQMTHQAQNATKPINDRADSGH